MPQKTEALAKWERFLSKCAEEARRQPSTNTAMAIVSSHDNHLISVAKRKLVSSRASIDLK